MPGDFSFKLDDHQIRGLGLSDEAADLLEDVGEVVADIAHDLAPKDTGAGADSIHGEVGEDEESAYVDISWDRDHFYMGFKELGTEHESAQPFLRPALDQAHI